MPSATGGEKILGFKGFCHCCPQAEEKGTFFVIRGFMATP